LIWQHELISNFNFFFCFSGSPIAISYSSLTGKLLYHFSSLSDISYITKLYEDFDFIIELRKEKEN